MTVSEVLTNRVKNFTLNHYSLQNWLDSRSVNKRLKRNPLDIEFLIYSRLILGQPLLFGRLGGIEAHSLGLYLDSRRKMRKPIRYLQFLIFINKRKAQLCNNAGVYPVDEENFEYFCRLHLEALRETDILSVWGKPFSWVETEATNRLDTLVVSGDFSYPWLESRDGISAFGWAKAFDGKKVLVVSPFVESISEQVHQLERIFPTLDIPKVRYSFIKAPMTQGGLNDGLSYKVHLEDMISQVKQQDFDILLVSAGAYSLPLAAFAKKMGRIGIHGGGATQIFFGITGSRYDDYAQVVSHINHYWKRPAAHERPSNWKSIENGCYW